ncbi:MAG TPA: YceD family protein [Solirubrobacterales bacterium]|jgi:uncharacterized protein
MANATTNIDLGRLSLSHGEGRRLELPVRLEPLELAGQAYAVSPESVAARLDVSRPSGGYAFRLRFPLRLEGPCMRCLEGAALETEVDAREVAQDNTDDEDLLSPYVENEELDLGRWAHDAAVLTIPTRFLCRPDCAGLCPDCGESLNDSDPSEHQHEKTPDPRWAKLTELELE